MEKGESSYQLAKTNFYSADASAANLENANLLNTNLILANFAGANLSGADLSYATLVDTNFKGANLSGCHVYGVSVWGVDLDGATQMNLVITSIADSAITLDNLEVAQFIYLLLNNKKIRDVIDTITSKVVLILGRFTTERKAVLEAIREELRRHNYLPVLFDFKEPITRDLTETISTLAHLAKFIIADITDAKSIPQELQAVVPTLAVPVQPLLEGSTMEYGMFTDFKKYHWVLEVHRYKDVNDLLASFEAKVITRAEMKAKELLER